MRSGKIRVLLADDHTLVRRGIAQLLAFEEDIEVIGEASDGLEAYAVARELRPDLILLDLEMPWCSGFETMERILSEMPEVVIVILTYSTSEKDAISALRHGAQGYLLKNMEPEALANRIREAMRGESPIAGAIARSVLLNMSRPEPAPEPPIPEPAPLTNREVQILKQMASGATNREIGIHLYLSENTVKNHVKSILGKLQMQNRAHAVAWAFRTGLLPGDPET